MRGSEEREADYSKAGRNYAVAEATMCDQARRAYTNDEVCAHHAPGGEQITRISNIRLAATNFLNAIDYNCPPCADRTDAKRKVREAMMTANASIALDGAV